MNRLFGGLRGKGSNKKAPTTLEAIVKLKETVELLEKKSAHIENKIQLNIQTAKENGTKNKRVALIALKKKRRLENQLLQIDGSISTLEFQIDALENANTNVEVIGSMRTASEALNNAGIEPEDAHEIMDNIAEQKDLQDEISEALLTFANKNADYDDDELLAELEALATDEVEISLPKTDKLDKLPEIPIESLPPKQKLKVLDDQDTRELAAWAT